MGVGLLIEQTLFRGGSERVFEGCRSEGFKEMNKQKSVIKSLCKLYIKNMKYEDQYRTRGRHS